MSPITFETFDPTPYQRAPRLNILRSLALGRALQKAKPRESSQTVERKAAVLARVLDEADAAVDARRRDSVPVDLAAETSFDAMTDALWAVLRDGLQALAGLGHEGVPRVAEGLGKQSAVAKAVRSAQDKARRARVLSVKLFGSEGLSFTKAQFPEQAQAMASILRVMEDDGLAPEVEALLGSEVLVLLRACQPLYEAMVEARLQRDDRKSSNLGKARNKVLRAISGYTTAVITMLDEDDPESLEVVLAALRPLEALREAAASGSTGVAESGGTSDEAGTPEVLGDAPEEI